MKVDWNKKYNTVAAYALIVLIISILFYIGISKVSYVKIQLDKYISIFHPIIMGLVMAYLFNFILEFYEDKLIVRIFDEKLEFKHKRTVGLLLTYITIILFLVLFLNFILPQLVNSIRGLISNIPMYVHVISTKLEAIEKNLNLPEEYSQIVSNKWEEYVDLIINFMTSLIPKIGNFAKGLISSLWNIVLGIIISIYLLIEKERFKAITRKMTTSMFSEKNTKTIMTLVRRADNIFGRFLSGKILDSMIIAVMTFGLLKIFNMPYNLLISFIVGITNIIPFFGPFIGAVPSFFIILLESPVKAVTFLVLIVIIQQIDGNIIGPKILGDSLGISAFWILFSLLVAGKLLGFVGLVIGVPLFVFIYSIVKDIVEAKLKKKGLPVETSNYYD